MRMLVYHCRSANTWKDDLALTITYFPQSRLTFAVLFGCTLATEEQALNRIATAKEHLFHPLLLVGIFVELEHTRLAEIVESTVDEIEAAIFELNSGAATREVSEERSEVGGGGGYEPNGPRHVRRTVWLNTTFLRSRLMIWTTQLRKITEHVDELLTSYKNLFSVETPEQARVDSQMDQTGLLIKNRIQVLIEELGGMIEECSMRLDSMTIATQWVRPIRRTRPERVRELTETGPRRHKCRHRRGRRARQQSNAIHLSGHHGVLTRHIFCGKFKI